MTFPGFSESDFDIFRIPDFAARMSAIRAELRPKLVALGEALAPRLAAIVPPPIVPHTAAHMRRRTNPPKATWLAFGRSSKGYKRFVHFRIAVNEGGLRATVHIEDDADDKPVIAAVFGGARDGLLTRLSRIEDLVWYSLRNGDEGPVTGTQLSAADLDQLARALSTLKTADFSAGIPFARTDPRLRSSTDLPPLLLETMRRLAPLYEAALPRMS